MSTSTLKLSSPLLKSPAGPSQRQWSVMSTEAGAICHICGKEWEEGERATLTRILGLQVVEECCGAVIDELFERFGEAFAIAFAEDMAEDPTNSRFSWFLRQLSISVREARVNLAARETELKPIEKELEELVKP